MKVAKKIICVITCSILILMITFGNVSCAAKDTYLEGKTYNSVEELHEDLIATMKQEATDEEDYFPREIFKYFSIEDVIAVLSTYSKTADIEIVQNELFVYFVKEINGQYKLLTPIGESEQYAIIKLGYEYTLSGNYQFYAELKVNNEKKSIYFLYKKIDETRILFVNSKASNELEMTNPFDGTQFILCYGIAKPVNLRYCCQPLSQRLIVALK